MPINLSAKIVTTGCLRKHTIQVEDTDEDKITQADEDIISDAKTPDQALHFKCDSLQKLRDS